MRREGTAGEQRKRGRGEEAAEEPSGGETMLHGGLFEEKIAEASQEKGEEERKENR